MTVDQPARHGLASCLVVGILTACLVGGWVVHDLHHSHSSVLSLIQPGAAGPSARVIEHDFGGIALPPGDGNDGQQFYAVARDPLHPSAIAAALDRPRYRLQRAGYPLLAWLLHPGGGGYGLVWSLVAVNVAGLAIGGWSLAEWARLHGHRPLWGVAFGLLPGAYMSLRISCADSLAAALALAAVVLGAHRRTRAAALVAVAAVLTRETALLLLVGPALWTAREDRRRALALIGPPAVVVAGLWAALGWILPGGAPHYAELAWPGAGVVGAARYWSATADWKPELTVIATIAVAMVAVRRGRPSAFTVSLWLELALTIVLSPITLEFWTGAPRVLLPLGLCALAHLLGTAPPSPTPTVAVRHVNRPRAAPASGR